MYRIKGFETLIRYWRELCGGHMQQGIKSWNKNRLRIPRYLLSLWMALALNGSADRPQRQKGTGARERGGHEAGNESPIHEPELYCP